MSVPVPITSRHAAAGRRSSVRTLPSFDRCRREADLTAATTGGIGPGGQPLGPRLKWPAYPKSAATQQNWDAASDIGRIKVELSSGFTYQVGEQVVYNKLTDVVCFSFFPAPIGTSKPDLQRPRRVETLTQRKTTLSVWASHGQMFQCSSIL